MAIHQNSIHGKRVLYLVTYLVQRFTLRRLSFLGVLLVVAGCGTSYQLSDMVRPNSVHPNSVPARPPVPDLPNGKLTAKLHRGGAKGVGAGGKDKDPTAIIGKLAKADADQSPEDCVAAPYPNRRNPFEYANAGQHESASSIGGNVEIKLFGFVGSIEPKAIINIDGRTHLLAEGDKRGQLEVLEVRPPQVRIRRSGVARAWSLMGEREN